MRFSRGERLCECVSSEPQGIAGAFIGLNHTEGSIMGIDFIINLLLITKICIMSFPHHSIQTTDHLVLDRFKNLFSVFVQKAI